jgi:MFS family permease
MTTTVEAPVSPMQGSGMTGEEKFVIFASSLGTVFEWYDFYLYAVLAPFFAALFFPPGNDTAALLSAFATYAAGFMVRPFGSMIFGRIGDLTGRKYTFLVTIMVMGTSTFLVGLLPTYARIGWLAPVLLVTLRLLQGLAVGGEYGGAATYVAEHARPGRCGYSTSWIQTTATLGLALALIIIIVCRGLIDAKAFAEWGWRIPFILSVVLLAFSVYLRLRLNETPIFQKMKDEGTRSTAPLTESFFHYPTVTADDSTCRLHVFVTRFTKFSSCDRARDLVTKLGVSFRTVNAVGSGDRVDLKIGATTIEGFDAARWNAAFLDAGYPNLQRDKDGKVVPKPADSAKVNWFMTELVLIIMVTYATMVYGPIAAFLVELFPTRIRYTSMSLPYHIGAGVFGGMLPLLATAVVAATGDIYYGLWYPIGVAVVTTVIGGLLLRDTKDVDITVGSGVEAAHRA